MLDTVSYRAYAEKNIILFLSFYPKGLKHEDIALLCRFYWNWFGDYNHLEISLFWNGRCKQAPEYLDEIESIVDFIDAEQSTSGWSNERFFLQTDVMSIVTEYFQEI